MRKTFLYLKGSHCPNVEILKEWFKKRCTDSDFREEVLACYEDGYLKKWLEELGSQVVLPEKGLSDTECFKSVYKAIVGEVCKVDFTSNFFNYAELKILSDDGVFVEPLGQTIFLNLPSGKLLFRFDSIGKGRETFKLSLKDDGGNSVGTNEILLGFDSKEEVQFEVKNPGIYALYEGENLLCKVSYCEKKALISSNGKRHLKLCPFYDDKRQLKYMTRIISSRDDARSMIEANKNYFDGEKRILGQYVRGLLEKLNEQYENYVFAIPTEEELRCTFNNKSLWELSSDHYRMAICETRNGNYECPKFTFKSAGDEDAVNAVCFLATEIQNETIQGLDGSLLKLYRLPKTDEEYLTEIITGQGFTPRKRISISDEILEKYRANFKGWHFEKLQKDYYELYKNKLPFKKQWNEYNVLSETWLSDQKYALVFLVKRGYN